MYVEGVKKSPRQTFDFQQHTRRDADTVDSETIGGDAKGVLRANVRIGRAENS